MVANLFPKSNLKSIFSEVESNYRLNVSTWLGYGKQKDEDLLIMERLCINIFEDIFNNIDVKVIAIVNHWDMNDDVFMLSQFDDYKSGAYVREEFVDEHQEVLKVQYYFDTKVKLINYKSILKHFVLRDYSSEDVNSRIFFINPKTETFLLYFDGTIELGSNNKDYLSHFLTKYLNNIEESNIRRFLEIE